MWTVDWGQESGTLHSPIQRSRSMTHQGSGRALKWDGVSSRTPVSWPLTAAGSKSGRMPKSRRLRSTKIGWQTEALMNKELQFGVCQRPSVA